MFLWKDEGRTAFLPTAKINLKKKSTELLKISTAINKEGPAEDLGLHLGWAHRVSWALNVEVRVYQREVIISQDLGGAVEGARVNKQGWTVVLGSEETWGRVAAQLPNASTAAPPWRTPCTTSPHRILPHCASPSPPLVSTHMHKSCNTRILGPKLQNYQYIQNRLGDLPSKAGGNGRMCQIPELFMIRVPNRSWRWHTDVPGHWSQSEKNGPSSPQNPWTDHAC